MRRRRIKGLGLVYDADSRVSIPENHSDKIVIANEDYDNVSAVATKADEPVRMTMTADTSSAVDKVSEGAHPMLYVGAALLLFLGWKHL